MHPTPLVAEIIGPDLLIILAVVMLLFGSTRIPKLARSLGHASHELKKGLAERTADDAPPAGPRTSIAVPSRTVEAASDGSPLPTQFVADPNESTRT
jgi:sec-independent protein translocase protein TatA